MQRPFVTNLWINQCPSSALYCQNAGNVRDALAEPSRRLVTGGSCLLGALTCSPKSSFLVNPLEEASPLHSSAWLAFCFVFTLLLFYGYDFWLNKNFLTVHESRQNSKMHLQVPRTQSHHRSSRVGLALPMPTFPHYFEANEKILWPHQEVLVCMCAKRNFLNPAQQPLHTSKAADRAFLQFS